MQAARLRRSAVASAMSFEPLVLRALLAQWLAAAVEFGCELAAALRVTTPVPHPSATPESLRVRWERLLDDLTHSRFFGSFACIPTRIPSWVNGRTAALAQRGEKDPRGLAFAG